MLLGIGGTIRRKSLRFGHDIASRAQKGCELDMSFT
jgi:hypothetical protein